MGRGQGRAPQGAARYIYVYIYIVRVDPAVTAVKFKAGIVMRLLHILSKATESRRSLAAQPRAQTPRLTPALSNS